MFILIVILLFIVSLLLSFRSLKTLNDKPGVGEVKKSLDKDRIIFKGHSSSR